VTHWPAGSPRPDGHRAVLPGRPLLVPGVGVTEPAELVSLRRSDELTMPAQCDLCGARRQVTHVIAGIPFPVVRMKPGGRRVYLAWTSHEPDCTEV